jgi:hypothetical protein
MFCVGAPTLLALDRVLGRPENYPRGGESSGAKIGATIAVCVSETVMTLVGSHSAHGPLSMVDVELVIDHHREALAQHPFLRGLEKQGTIEQFRRLLQGLAFFTLVFQDVLRLAQERCTDPQVKAVAHTLERGDRGHEQWYLEDLERLGIPLDVRWMFSADHAPARDIGYKLLSEVLTAGDDRSRLSVMLSLEAMAREFFIRVPSFAERVGARGLKYFGVGHLAAEEGHQIFADDGQRQLTTINIPDEIVPEVLTAIERTFAAMAQYGDHLEAAMRAGSDGTEARSLEQSRVP